MVTGTRRVRLLVLVSILAGCIIISLLALVDVHFNQIADWFAPPKDWVEFKVPDGARQVRASIQKVNQAFRICNEDGVDWSDVTVRMTGMYNAPYVAQTKPLNTGACVDVRFSEFAEPSWKRMRMPPNEVATKIELLVTYKSKGYVSLQYR